ncbi:hypothetical protein XHC_2193 [Xanthomonas hortorum pv. carotae str. M081]|nr:hypothetical protein XHC_2193 [Xanthomonas hortorum pv. carotae str. M081]
MSICRARLWVSADLLRNLQQNSSDIAADQQQCALVFAPIALARMTTYGPATTHACTVSCALRIAARSTPRLRGRGAQRNEFLHGMAIPQSANG